jgi:effector-binding domain-containing protein
MLAAVAEGPAHVPGALATPLATYSITEAGMEVAVGYAYAGDAPSGSEAIDLPVVEAVCGVQLGSMTTIGESWQPMHRWIVDNGLMFAGPCRELHLRAEARTSPTG